MNPDHATPDAPASAHAPLRHRLLRWPLPALLAWLLAWFVFAAAGGGVAGFVGGVGVGTALAAFGPGVHGRWRQAMVAGGFPVSVVLLGAAPGLPAWAWAAPVALLLLAYPLRAWRDAPFFPTPVGALRALATAAPLPAGARVLDAGCGAGHGLAELARAYPHACVEGVEWSPALAALAARRCRGFASVRRGDMWTADWRGLALVYLFQRPESMPRAAAKAATEMPGAWLASLEFEVAGWTPVARLAAAPGARPVWLYRVPSSTDGRPRR